jgi:bis(5'-nucleosyl)-tetraphosphatase (symmetrical)
MSTYAIGDLQGCLDCFERLLARIEFDAARDRLWLTGDLVNRGPDSLGTLRRVRGLGECATTVLGNHDLHLLAVALTSEGRTRKGDTLDDILTAPDRVELLDWLRHQPLFHHDPVLNISLVHAGIPSTWTVSEAASRASEVEIALRGPSHSEILSAIYGNTPDRWSPELVGIPRLRFIINALTRMRFCTDDGQLDLKHKESPAQAGPGLMPWFAVPGRANAGARIVFGHWSTLRLSSEEETRYRVHPLDTGAVWGDRLTALRLEDGARFSVPGVSR